MKDRREWRIGSNHVYFEEPDLVVVNLSGPMPIEEVEELLAVYREVGSRHPFFLIVNTADSVIDAKGRSYLTREIRPEWCRGVVYVGMGAVQRGLGKAMTSALRFKGTWTVDMEFLATEAEAREAVARMRAKASPTLH